jgi:hypothetical protein
MRYRQGSRGGLGGRGDEPESGHINVYVAERRNNVSRLYAVDWDEFKERHPDFRTIGLNPFGLEFIHLDGRSDIQEARRRLIKSGKIPSEDPDEVRRNLLIQLKWIKGALQGYQSGDFTAEVMFYEHKMRHNQVRCFFRLYPDGTVEKSEEAETQGPSSLVPLGNVRVSTHWAAYKPDGILLMGETTVNAPKERIKDKR